MITDGRVFTQVDVDAAKCIEKMCQEIGVVDKCGNTIGELDDGKIFARYEDEYGIRREYLLYDKPFDVEYAAILINLYKKTCEYQRLLDESYERGKNGKDLDKTGDYKIAYRLELMR